jgi:cytochrome d ubiquinol oxidase subunit II
VTAVLWAWALAQYPFLLRGRLTIAAAAAQHSVLMATLICLAAGAVLLIPSLTWLYVLFQRSGPPPARGVPDRGR